MALEIKVFNNHAEMGYDGSFGQTTFINTYLTATDMVRQGNRGREKVEKTYNLYKKLTKKIVFPRGFVDFWGELDYVKIYDLTEKSVIFPKLPVEEIKEILQPESGFDLRDDQVTAVRKALYFGRGIIQMPPGSGKTEVQAAVLKALLSNNKDLKVLVIEPTTELGEGVVERFNNYNLNASFYSNTRNTDSQVIVAHVSALLNDLEKDKNLLEDFKVVIWDESHHSQCSTWLKLNLALKNVEVSLGFSALAIDEKNINVNNYENMSYPEKLISGSTGRVLFHVGSSYYIDRGFLATPIVFQLDNIVEEVSSKDNDWHNLFSKGINSVKRNNLVAKVVNMFSFYGRKALVLVGTKEQAFDIVEILIENFDVNLLVSFGGKESYFVKNGSIESYKGGVLDYFNSGEYLILLATTHLDEGVDIQNLDACVLASGGKKDRRLIQRLGRVLRKTKTGKNAYIIDFADKGNGVLHYHANQRVGLYEKLIGVTKKDIIKVHSISMLDTNFKTLEEI